MDKYYKDCDAVLRKHLQYQDKIDSSPIEPRHEPKFITICEDVLGLYDIEYFRALHHELKSNGLIQINLNQPNLDELFYRNVLTQKGFHFCKTTSFVKEYKTKKQKEKRNELFIVLGIIAAIISAIFSGLDYFKADSNEKLKSSSSKLKSQKIKPLPQPPKRQLNDTLASTKLTH